MSYEDGYQALNQGIVETGTSRKELAMTIYPGLPVNTAQSKFTRAMSPENSDVHLSLEMIETILEVTRADDFIFYLCDKHGFDRPNRKPAAVETRIMRNLETMQKQMAVMMKELEEIRAEKAAASPLHQEQKDVDSIREVVTAGVRRIDKGRRTPTRAD